LVAADLNVVLGLHMQNRLISEGVGKARIKIIHNWADEDAVHPVTKGENRLGKEWGLSDKFVVGYSGNMGRAHEFGAILDAAEMLRKRTDIVFLFIGDGGSRPWVEEQVSTRNLTNVIFKPYQPRERLAESLSVPDVHFISLKPRLEGLIVPSKFYGIIAAGRPVLFAGSPTGEIANMIKKAKCGVSVELEDARALAAAIEHLVEETGHCAQMGINARAAFDRFYGMEKSLQAWSEVLGVGQERDIQAPSTV
jgi:glycosyltransferase involved in cell wall biosynthesis